MNRLGFDGGDRGECQHCGAHVSRDFRRTFGDGDDVAHRCPACDSSIRLERGSAAGRDVSHPDPEDQPNRNRGSRTEARAAAFSVCNRSDAVARACDAVPAVARAVENVLNRDDSTTRQKREIAETLSTRGLSFEVETEARLDDEE